MRQGAYRWAALAVSRALEAANPHASGSIVSTAVVPCHLPAFKHRERLRCWKGHEVSL